MRQQTLADDVYTREMQATRWVPDEGNLHARFHGEEVETQSWYGY